MTELFHGLQSEHIIYLPVLLEKEYGNMLYGKVRVIQLDRVQQTPDPGPWVQIPLWTSRN